MAETVVIVCGALLLLCLILDFSLRRIKFRKADARAEKLADKYRYKGW